MSKKPLFWILLTLASIGSIFFGYTYFSKAFPIVTLDLQMDRDRALASARELTDRFRFGPEGYRQAASFGGDQQVQVFVELEAGGTEAFEKMMREHLYMPYTWNVRHYKESETREARLRFTPKGDPYGFVIKLPEKDPGPALSADSAQALAVRSATQDWAINLANYQLAEKAQEVRPGGRIDHSFVYQRTDAKIGEGFYRLRLVVGGDQLTELTHFVKVPEAFNRRYEEMRSANNLINTWSGIGLVIYIIAGCGVGMFFLLRQRWILWRAPLFWGLVMSFLQLLVGINQWPLLWMNYDTAISAQGFVLQQIALLVLYLLWLALLFTVSFMAAESLSRKAFPHHLQQWRLWSPDIAGSQAVLGRTVAGYLMVGIFFAYEVALYFATTKWLGWWSPSDVLLQPDILATYFPWLSSIAISAQAGFWEESLFRAVPIAGAALLGDRFGGRKWWIAGAMALQALIFGSAHAGYANQPAYARVVELIIPSLMFGGIYLAFGLLPAIVLHFTFDVVWLALPLFVSTAPGIWVDRAPVILLTLIPLWVVLYARVRARRWNEITEAHLNKSWQPPQAVPAPMAVEERPQVGVIHPLVVRYLPWAGLIGLGLWIGFSKFDSDAPALNAGRSQVEALAKQTLKERGIELPSTWKALTAVHTHPHEEDRFVWQTAGEETYRHLTGNHLTPPHWRIRFVQFEGDVAERAEEYQVFIAGNGEVFRFRHQLPEARPGASIAEDDARILAHLSVKGVFQLEASTLKEVSAVPSKQKERTDWLFTFADTVNYKLKEGEARLAVRIAGDKVVDAYRFVHVPEEWSRRERDERNIPRILQTVCKVIVGLFVIAGIVGGIVRWSRKQFAASTFLLLLALLFVVSATSLLNNFPSMVAQFSTAQPYMTQVFIRVGSSIIGALLLSAGLGIVAGFVQKWNGQLGSSVMLPAGMSWALGISLAAVLAGMTALVTLYGPSLSPRWADYSPLGTYVPLMENALDAVKRFFTPSIILLLLYAGVDRFTHAWTKRKTLFALLLVLFGLVVVGSFSIEAYSQWLLLGGLTGLVSLGAYVFVLRYALAISVIAVGVASLIGLLKEGFYSAYPDAVAGATAAIVVTLVAMWWWHGRLSKQ